MNKKIISLITVVACFFSLISCNGEEEVNYVSPNYLVGFWEVTQTGALNSQNVLNYEDVVTACSYDSYLFNEDMTFTMIDNSLTETCVSETVSGTYVVENGYAVLSYTVDGVATTKTLDLLTLTNTEMSFVFTNSDTELVFLKLTKSEN